MTPAALFELRAGPFVQGELRVLEFKGREALSKLFSFEVLFACDAPSAELEPALLGQAAALVIHGAAQSPRVVHGIGASLRTENAWKAEHATRRYTLRIVPAIWKLGLRVDTRIFQDHSASEVVATVLRDAGLAVRFDLAAPLPKRGYCVQYQESDLAFVRRLLAEAGCYFYFEPPLAALAGLPAPGETLVVSDAASFYPAIHEGGADEVIERVAGVVGHPIVSNLLGAPTLVHREPGGAQLGDGDRTVTRLNLERAIRSNAVAVREYAYERPLYDATGVARTLGPGAIAGAASALARAALNEVGAAARRGAAPGGGLAATGLDLITGLPSDFEAREVYRHHADFFELDASHESARRELEQHRRRAWHAKGASLCRRLASGHKFALAEHDEERMNRVWVVTSVRHRGVTIEWAARRGSDGEVLQYENAFTCAPAEITVRPRRPRPRAVQVADTAVVVGPENAEVHTDALGRIRVQFHWDRHGRKDEHASCWIRVLQPWSGSSWGAQFIPRIGMEVLVLYHQGDPDRPVVIGCLPNAATPMPFPLPEDATRSGFRSRTLPGGGGHNELSFEDRQGSEQLFLRAQRNLDEVVLRDHSVDVGRNERETVRGSRNVTVQGDDALTVGGDLAVTVAGARTESVRGTRIGRVEGDAKDTVDGLEQRSIGGSAYLTTRGNYQLMVSGTAGTLVGSRDVPTESHTAVWGKSELFASDEIRIQSEKTIVLVCGESKLTLGPERVTVEGKAIVVDGHESTSIFGKKPVMHFTDAVTLASDEITLTAKGASLDLGSDATLLGAQIKLGKGRSATTEARDSAIGETQPFSLRLCDAAFRPYAAKLYDLMVAGERFRGTTDGDGNLAEQVPKGATVGDLTLWLRPPPTGAHLRWQVRIDDAPPPASDVRGAQLRLRNLGYFAGEPDGETSDAFADAIRAFQRDQDLPNDGVLGGATLGRLATAHGH